jgi:hypothetical protein
MIEFEILQYFGICPEGLKKAERPHSGYQFPSLNLNLCHPELMEF